MKVKSAKARIGIGGLTALATLLAVGCGGSSGGGGGSASTAAALTSSSQQGPRQGQLAGLEILPAGGIQVDTNLGSAFQILVDGHYRTAQGDMFQRDLSRDVTYTSDDAQVATVGGDGLITPVGLGTTRIEARFANFTAETTVEVIAPTPAPSTFTRLLILPPFRELDLVDPMSGTEQLQQLLVVATDASGRKYDLTRSTGITIQDTNNAPSVLASVNNSGLVRGVANGEVIAVARLSNQGLVAGSNLVLGTGVAKPVDPNTLYSGAPLAGSGNAIDRAVLEGLFKQFIEPAPLATDGEFLRRLYADALGRVPTEAELVAFTASTASDKRAAEVTKVLADPGFATHWASIMGEWFAMERGANGGMFDTWAAQAIAADETLADMVSEMATGAVPAFETRHATAADKVDALLLAGAGMTASCAKCHDHPLTGPSDTIKWTQADRYPLDAFFATSPGEATPLDKTGVRVGNPFNPGFVFDANANVTTSLNDPLAQRRAEFAQLFTTSSVFKRGLGHRIFAEVCGPLLNPNQFLQQELDTVAVPSVLDAITAAFDAQNTSLKGFLEVIFTSSFYGLSSSAEGLDVANDPLLQRSMLRRHHAEVMDSAVDSVTGAALTGGNLDFFHQTFGYPMARETVAERVNAVNMSQAFVLQNSPVVQGRLTGDNVAQLAADVAAGTITEAEAVQSIFRAGLSREAAADELQLCLDTIAQAGSVGAGLEDVASAVLGTAEFILR